jgi:carboxymethylenebutenolidase
MNSSSFQQSMISYSDRQETGQAKGPKILGILTASNSLPSQKSEDFTMELTATDGHKFSCHTADPASAPKGTIVVIHDVFGVDPYIKKLTTNFAAQGYTAIVPSLFDRVRAGETFVYDEQGAAGEAVAKQITEEQALADIQATIAAVKEGGKIAVVGYSWGAYLAYLAANRIAGLACAIGYSGTEIPAMVGEKRKIPTLLHFGELDETIPAESIIQFRARRPDVSAYTYAAGRGFECSERSTYDENAAAKALERTLFWISQYVEGQSPIALKNAGSYAAARPEKKKKPATAAADGPPD